MNDSLITVVGFFCVAPLAFMGFGFWLGRFTKGLKLVRDQNGDDMTSARYAKAESAPPPKQTGQGGRIRRIQQGQPSGQGGGR